METPRFTKTTDGPEGFEMVTHTLVGSSITIEDAAIGGRYSSQDCMVGSDPYRYEIRRNNVYVDKATSLKAAKAIAIKAAQ